MFFPTLTPPRQIRASVTRFLGYDRSPRTAEGAFTAMENMTSQSYPTLSVRPRRGTVAALNTPLGLIARDNLVWCDGTHLVIGGYQTGLVLSPNSEK